jgi:hypothetical protein
MTTNVAQISSSQPLKDSLSVVNDNFAFLQKTVCALNNELCSLASEITTIADKIQEIYSYLYFTFPQYNIPPVPEPKVLPNVTANTTLISGANISWPAVQPILVPFPIKNL